MASEEPTKQETEMSVRIIVLTIFLFGSCSRPQISPGIFVSADDPLREFLFQSDKFVLRYNRSAEHPIYYCTDTIGFGSWSPVDRLPLIALSSEPSQLVSMTSLNAMEELSRDVPGKSLRFVIANPIETHLSLSGLGVRIIRPIIYGLDIKWSCSDFDMGLQFYERLRNERYASNEFTVAIPEGFEITSFSVQVYPSNCLDSWRDGEVSSFRSEFYDLREPESNSFIVQLPELTFCYMNALRLNSEFVLVESSKVVVWNGSRYILRD